MRSRKHRWLERFVAFGGLAYWLLSTALGLAFAAALLTSFTALSELRVIALLLVVLAAFGALAAHRWRPPTAQAAHWAMLVFAALYLGTCVEFVELPPTYRSFDHRGIRVEYADEGVARDGTQIRNLIDQVYARSGLKEPTPPLRMRFMKNTGGRPITLGDWSDAAGGGADVILTTSGGGTRGESFLLEGSFLLTEALVRRSHPSARQGPANGFAYWTMLGVTPQPDWAARWLRGEFKESCSILSRVTLGRPPSGELTIWISGPQEALHLEADPFIEAERRAGLAEARRLFERVAAADDVAWRELVRQHCAR